MKFGKRYTEYVEKEGPRLQGCSYVQFKRHKKLLKRCCRKELLRRSLSDPSRTGLSTCSSSSSRSSPPKSCPLSCTVCDGMFFPNLLNEVSSVVGCFNSRAQELLEFHLSSKFQRFLLRMKRNVPGDHAAMIQEGKNLVKYASMNAIAIRKILKKYDKVHHSVAGRTFRSRLQAMHAELLQSPWLIELTALYMNLKSAKSKQARSFPESFEDCSFDFDNAKATLHCIVLDAQNVEVDLTCSICLETLFEPVALGCGHIFCNSCACSAASVATVDGLKAASRQSKCPLCRQTGVYADGVLLTELNLLIKNRCADYWNQRQPKEREERLRQFRERYEKQVQDVLGM